MSKETDFHRVFPRGVDAVYNALNKALDMQNGLQPGEIILIDPLIERLVDVVQKLKDLKTEKVKHAAAASTNVGLKVPLFEDTEVYVNHFIQVFNLGVKRKIYGIASRSYYQLDINQSKVPYLGNEENVVSWGKKLVKGEELRTAAGEPAMTNPDIGQLSVLLNKLINSRALQVILNKNETDTDAKIVKLMVEAIEVMHLVWDAVESFYQHKLPATKRALCRKWGVIYVTSSKISIIIGLCVDESGNGVEDVIVTDDKTNGVDKTNKDGRYEKETTYIGKGELIFTYPGKPTQRKPFDSTAGETTEMGNVVI